MHFTASSKIHAYVCLKWSSSKYVRDASNRNFLTNHLTGPFSGRSAPGQQRGSRPCFGMLGIYTHLQTKIRTLEQLQWKLVIYCLTRRWISLLVYCSHRDATAFRARRWLEQIGAASKKMNPSPDFSVSENLLVSFVAMMSGNA